MSAEKLELSSPIGGLVAYLTDKSQVHSLSEGQNDCFGLEVSVSCKEVTSDVLKNIHYDVNEVYLLNFELIAKADVSGLQMCFDLEDVIDSKDKSSELETGQFFEAVCWETDIYSAHLGFRNTVDEPFEENLDFNDFELYAPEDFHRGLILTIPDMSNGKKLSFPVAFAWTKKSSNEEDSIATNVAVDTALPMPIIKD